MGSMKNMSQADTDFADRGCGGYTVSCQHQSFHMYSVLGFGVNYQLLHF